MNSNTEKTQTRRSFLKSGAVAATVGLALSGCRPAKNSTVLQDKWGDLLPKRKLGRTGETVTMLGVGGYHVGWTTEEDAIEVIETAIQGGVRFFDTAESYQKGESERRYGKYLVPRYRDEVFLMSKSTARDAATAQKHLDDTLLRLNCDYLDLWQIHSLSNPDDVDNRLKNGVLDVFLKAKSTGKVRYIGFTGHRNPEAHMRMLEQTIKDDPFDTCQMPVNAVDPSYHSFINQVMPKLQKRNIALLGMKSLADGRFFALKKTANKVNWTTEDPVIPSQLSVRDAIHFAWSYPMSVLITGAENASLLREKIDFAHTYQQMNDSEQKAIIEKVASYSDQKIEYFKKPVTA